MKNNNYLKGSKGEKIAREYLIKKGYTIIRQNYRSKDGEIDIICEKDNFTIFVEVKYRKNIEKGMPIEAVDFKKQNKIRSVAVSYIGDNTNSHDFRFDVIGILEMDSIKIDHIENAF